MSSRRAGSGAENGLAEHPDQHLARLPGGGFALESAGRPTVRVDPTDDGWRIVGGEGQTGWTLRRAEAQAAGFVLRACDSGAEAGRTMPLVGVEDATGPKFLLLDDGRLFRLVRRSPREDGFELLGWETPGAYMLALPTPEGWTLTPTVAGGGLQEIGVISILFAAEILDAEERLGSVTP